MEVLAEPLQLTTIKTLGSDIHCLQSHESGTLFYWSGSRTEVKQLFVIINGVKILAKLPAPSLRNPSVMNDAFYCYNETKSKKNKKMLMLVKFSVVDHSLRMESLKNITTGMIASECQSLYLWKVDSLDLLLGYPRSAYYTPPVERINIHPFDVAKGEKRVTQIKGAHPRSIKAGEKWILHRGILIVIREATTIQFERLSSTDNNFLALSLSSKVFNVYSDDALDYFFITDCTRLLWIANPASLSIIEVPIIRSLLNMQSFEIVGVAEDKLLMTQNLFGRPGFSSCEMVAASVKDAKINYFGRAKGVETGSSLLRAAGMQRAKQPVDVNLDHADLRTDLADSKRAIVAMKESVDALAKAFEEKQDRIIRLLD